MSLHLIFSIRALSSCRDRRSDEDVLLLIGDGVYTAAQAPECLVLAEDAHIRGVECDNEQIDYSQFVALCETHQPVVSWND